MSEHIVGVNPKEYNGRLYKSTFEANTAEMLDKMGIPWEYESKIYTVQEGFYCPWEKRKILPIRMKPDFIIGPVMLETKGYETPDWKIKKKLLFKYFMENEPDAIYHVAKNNKEIIEALDLHLSYLGYYVEVTNKPTRKQPAQTKKYDSIREALADLGMPGRSITPIIRSLTGSASYIYGYNWKLKKLTL